MGPRTYIRGNQALRKLMTMLPFDASMGPRTYIRGNQVGSSGLSLAPILHTLTRM